MWQEEKSTQLWSTAVVGKVLWFLAEYNYLYIDAKHFKKQSDGKRNHSLLDQWLKPLPRSLKPVWAPPGKCAKKLVLVPAATNIYTKTEIKRNVYLIIYLGWVKQCRSGIHLFEWLVYMFSWSHNHVFKKSIL